MRCTTIKKNSNKRKRKNWRRADERNGDSWGGDLRPVSVEDMAGISCDLILIQQNSQHWRPTQCEHSQDTTQSQSIPNKADLIPFLNLIEKEKSNGNFSSLVEFSVTVNTFPVSNVTRNWQFPALKSLGSKQIWYISFWCGIKFYRCQTKCE